MSKVTIYDIAKALQVTPSTVSRALSDHPRISARTKQAVRETAQKLNYQGNKVASALRSGKTFTLGVMVPTINRSFFSSVIWGIEQVVNQAGYHVVITQSNDQVELERANIQALLRAQVDGVIASIAKDSRDCTHLAHLPSIGVPLVLFDRTAALAHSSLVRIDDFRGAYQATAHLLAQGCRRIAHFAGHQQLDIYRQRLSGYKSALADHGVPCDEQLLYFSNLTREDGQAGMASLLLLPERPDAVFSASDYAAVGAMQVLRDQGLRIPEEVALVGFMNEAFASFVDPGLSSVDQLAEDMGEVAARTFLAHVATPPEAFTPRKVILEPKLVIRSSSMRKG
jgi:LacI family transcriptional regulator